MLSYLPQHLQPQEALPLPTWQEETRRAPANGWPAQLLPLQLTAISGRSSQSSALCSDVMQVYQVTHQTAAARTVISRRHPHMGW